MDAMKTGNLKKFNDSRKRREHWRRGEAILTNHVTECSLGIDLEANQEFFIKKGVYLLLEKLKTFVYRNLFRKVFKFCQSTLPEKTRNQIPLGHLQVTNNPPRRGGHTTPRSQEKR